MSPAEKSQEARIVAEVLELGEALVDSLIDAATNERAVDDEESCSEKEWRETAEAFFVALRLLLDGENRERPE